MYKLEAQQPTAFHDIPAGSTIAMPCVTGKPNCVTATAGDAYGILSGYNSATGYDLATGLGSVDVANLVNKWQSVSFAPSTTALTLNGGASVNITHGTPVGFNIEVTPSAATGEAALMVAPGTPGDAGIAEFALNMGSVASSTALLPGGSYSLLAHYGGDSNYGGSYSNAVPVNVISETSVVLPNLVNTGVNGVPISFSASSATYGSGYQIFRVDVGDAKAAVSPTGGITSQCASQKESCPTGKVTLSAPGTVLDGVTLVLNSEGFAETAALPPGTYAVTATYAGDASFGAGSASTTFTIAKAPTTVSAGVEGLLVSYGNQEQVGADVVTNSDGVAPTGTFQIYVDGSPLGQPLSIYESGAYGGVANGKPNYAWADALTLTYFLSPGNHTVSASYSGDANYAAGTGPATTFSVVQEAASILDMGINNPMGQPVIAGQSATGSVVVVGSQMGVAPTGTTTLYDNGTALGGTYTYTSANAPGMLNATWIVVINTPGIHQITASYSGDANYTAAKSSGAQSLTVLGPVNVTSAGGATVAQPGQTGTTTLAVTPNGGFTGAVTLSCTPDPKASETTCGLTSGTTSGSSVQLNVMATGLNVSFNVTTTASHQVAQQQTPLIGSMAKIALACMPILILPLFKRYRGYLICVMALVLALSLGACGGGGGGGGNGGGTTDPGTAAGSYTYAVTATTGNGASQITSTTQVSVVVN